MENLKRLSLILKHVLLLFGIYLYGNLFINCGFVKTVIAITIIQTINDSAKDIYRYYRNKVR